MATPPARGWSEKHDARAREEGYDSWAAWIEAVEEEKGHAVCGGWAKSRRAPCVQPYREENTRGRCRSHGGNSLTGAALPQFKHGRYSEYLPDLGSLERIEELRRQLEGQLELTRERAEGRALVDQLRQLLQRKMATVEDLAARNGGPGDGQPGRRAAIRAAFERLQQSESKEATQAALSDLDRLTRHAAQREAAEAELLEIADKVMNALDKLRKMSGEERRRYVDTHEMLSKDRIRTLAGYIGASMRDRLEEHLTGEALAEGALQEGAPDDVAGQLATVLRPVAARLRRRIVEEVQGDVRRVEARRELRAARDDSQPEGED